MGAPGHFLAVIAFFLGIPASFGASLRSLYSDEGQDTWVLAMLGKASKNHSHRFLDIGARDGNFFSNTRRLEENGWNGTCIEPFPSNFKKFHRTCALVQKAIVAKKNVKRIYSNCEDGSGVTGWSGFTATNKNAKNKIKKCTQTEVPQTTFAELNLPKTLDYISLDVEGLELEILKSFPFDAHCSKLWTVEGAGFEYRAEVSNPIVQILTQHGCKRVKQSHSDGFFTCECH
jgi:FkbM family methyltransferase